MINVWGICELGGIVTTQMIRWDSYCYAFYPKEAETGESSERCCGGCVYWLVSDEHLTAQES